MVWITASMPAIWPAHSCTDPAALWMSSAMIDRIAFPMMRLRVTATPIGRTPEFLFSVMSRHAIKLSTETGSTYSVHGCLVAAAMASQSLSECRLQDVQRRFHSRASSPEGPDEPLAFNAEAQIRLALIPSITMV